MRLEELILAFLVPGELQRHVGEHFIGVHIGRSSGATLVPVHHKLIVIFSVDHGLARFFNRVQVFLFHRPTSVFARAAAIFTMA